MTLEKPKYPQPAEISAARKPNLLSTVEARHSETESRLTERKRHEKKWNIRRRTKERKQRNGLADRHRLRKINSLERARQTISAMYS